MGGVGDSDENLHTLLEALPIHVWTAQPDGALDHVTLRTAQFFGLTSGELLGAGWQSVIHPDDLSNCVAKWTHSLETGAPYLVDFRLRRADGVYVWHMSTAVAMRDDAGTILRWVGKNSDISERKAAEARLEAEHQRFVDLVNSTEGVVWEADALTFAFTFVSDHVERLLGYPSSQWLEDPTFWLTHVHPDDRAATMSRCARSTRAGESHQLEYRMIAADGRIVWIEDRITVLMQEGVPKLLRGVLIDITERKARDAELLRNAELWALARDAVVAADARHILTSWNPAAERLYGWSAAEALGRNGLELLQTEFSGGGSKPDTLRAVATDGYWRGEVRQSRKDGSRIDVEVESTVLKNAAGTIVGFVSFNRDISERKRQEEEVRRSEDRLARVLLATNDGWWDWDLVANSVYCSPKWLHMLGYQAGDPALTGEAWPRLIHPDDMKRVMDSTQTALSAPETTLHEEEFRLRHKLGHYVPMLSRSFVVRDANGKALRVSGANTDLTEKKLAEATKRTLMEQLRESQKMESLGALAGGIAHDFNNILGAVLGNVGIAQESLEDRAALKECLREVELATRRAGELVQQILTFSRKKPPELRVLSLHTIVDEAVRLLRVALPASVELSASARVAPLVNADATQIHQILMNIGTNAGRALRDGHTGRRGTISIEVDEVVLDADALVPIAAHLEAGKYARLTIRDNGAGMDAATRARIFEPFFTTRPVGEGTGLGLAVVHGIVASHGGAMAVESEVGNGTTFHVYLPCATTTETRVPPPVRTPHPIEKGRRGHVLFVDDEPQLVRLATRALESLGYRVSGHEDARSALAVLALTPDDFDLLVTDYDMPHVSGIDLAREAMTVRPSLPVVLVSGAFKVEVEKEATDLGIQRIMQKPMAISALRTMVGELITAPAR